jgi:aminoglycoside phosphotransferase (APT) family kinase protein
VSAVLDLELAQSGDPAMDFASLVYCDGRDGADLSAILRGYGRQDLLAPEETLPKRLLFYQMLYALDHLFWEHGFRNERGIAEALERLRRFEEALDQS